MKATSWDFSSGRKIGAMEKGLPIGKFAAGADAKITKLPGMTGAWTQSRDIPAPPTRSFRQRWGKDHAPSADEPRPESDGNAGPEKGEDQ